MLLKEHIPIIFAWKLALDLLVSHFIRSLSFRLKTTFNLQMFFHYCILYFDYSKCWFIWIICYNYLFNFLMKLALIINYYNSFDLLLYISLFVLDYWLIFMINVSLLFIYYSLLMFIWSFELTYFILILIMCF